MSYKKLERYQTVWIFLVSKFLLILCKKLLYGFFLVGLVADVLNHTTSETFEQQFGRPKPDPYSPLIFTCRSGKRATTAAEMVEKVGYKK